jgi:hypothetical protein
MIGSLQHQETEVLKYRIIKSTVPELHFIVFFTGAHSLISVKMGIILRSVKRRGIQAHQ